MRDVREDFRKRVAELGVCLRHIKKLDQKAGVDPLVFRALKAGCYVQAYNLIESTATQVVAAIFDHLKRAGISFDDVREELKTFVLKHAKMHEPRKLAALLQQVAPDLLSRSVDPEKLFSGNIDVRKLRQLAGEICYRSGAKGKTQYLLTIKNARNDLAHGSRSFVEVGRDVTMPELRDHVAAAVWHMRSTVENVEAYLNAKNYLVPRNTAIAGA